LNKFASIATFTVVPFDSTVCEEAIYVWKKGESRKWDGHKDAVLSVAVSAATRQAASGAYDGEVVLWNIDEGKIIRRFHATPGGVEGKENPPLPRQGEGRGKG
ncbi:MAG: hypothetical protein ACPHL9_06490, partial [Limisphaerales bacterium]